LRSPIFYSISEWKASLRKAAIASGSCTHAFDDVLGAWPSHVIDNMFLEIEKAKRIYKVMAEDRSVRAQLREDIGVQLLRQCIDLLEPHLQHGHAKAWCSKCEAFCPLESTDDFNVSQGHLPQETRECLRMAISGTMCISFSTRGGSDHLVHHTVATTAACLVLRRFLQEDIFIHECTPLFKKLYLSIGLSRFFLIQKLPIGGAFLGLCKRRERSYSICIHFRRVLAYSFDFTMDSMKCFEKTCQMTCSAFWCAEESLVVQWHKEKLIKQGCYEILSLFDAGLASVDELCAASLDGGETGRLILQMRYIQNLGYGDVVLDLSQNLHMCRPDRTSDVFMPTLCRSSRPWLRGRFMIPEEKLTTLGIAALQSLQGKGAATPFVDLSLLSSAERGEAASNGMLIEAVMAVSVWSLLCIAYDSADVAPVFQFLPIDSTFDRDDMGTVSPTVSDSDQASVMDTVTEIDSSSIASDGDGLQ
jgi:hypothetical protein